MSDLNPTNYLPWIVMKFGGTSVASPATWHSIAAQIRLRLQDGFRPLIVCSALSGVTDRLEGLIALALQDKHAAKLAELRDLHQALIVGLGLKLNAAELLEQEFATLERLLAGLALTNEPTPRLRARILSQGELMSTRIGAAFLATQALDAYWLDARTILTTVDVPQATLETQYLDAFCRCDRQHELGKQLTSSPAKTHSVYITQGFIASNARGETVLLGRGGSDVSASYYGALLGAELVEFWTDVPGMYTADPHRIPQARLLTSLNYAEAQELASVGAKVLHPRSLQPLQEAGIPIDIRCTLRPTLRGTHISSQIHSQATVKAVASRSHVVLVTLDDIGMWQQVGFLAKAFATFAKHGLSIDLVATSQTNVTLSLDATANLLNDHAVAALLHDLGEFCTPHLISPCATISLVGTKIRSILHQLGPALELFEEEKVHLLSQAASDLNLTFVVDENQAARLLSLLHSQLFSGQLSPTIFGPSWREDFTPEAFSRNAAAVSKPWWQTRRDDLLALDVPTPAYIYDQATLQACVKQLQQLESVDQIMYAMKANAHPQILQLFNQLGTGFECVSRGEVERLRELFPTLPAQRIIFTPNFAARSDYEYAFTAGVTLTCDNAEVFDYWPDLFANREVFLRLDLGHGVGHSRKVRTAGSYSKFGIPLADLPALREKLAQLKVRVVGLHSHSGSGIKTADTWARSALALSEVAESFPEAKVLDLGGGLGVPERSNTEVLDLTLLDQQLAQFKKNHPAYTVWIEPGRFLVAQAGVILTHVTQVKTKHGKHFVGLDAGMNNLIRPALYGAYHEIVNLSRLEERPSVTADVVGPICETGDILGRERHLPPCHPGDMMLIATTGAYGQAMSSNYNLRGPAYEQLV